MSQETIQALEDRCENLAEERDRFFHMKRRNAGSYADVRKKVQDTRAVLLASETSESVAQALEILGAPSSPPEWLPELLEHYAKKYSNFGDREHAHIQMMCTKVEEFLTTGQEDKANRWLGFIQGVLWLSEIYDIDQLRAHMRGEAP